MHDGLGTAKRRLISSSMSIFFGGYVLRNVLYYFFGSYWVFEVLFLWIVFDSGIWHVAIAIAFT